MRKVFSKLWVDDGGFITSVEMLFITVILVIGLVAGWAGLRAAIVEEYTELGNAILYLNEGYEIDGISGITGGSYGSNATDAIATLTLIQKAATAVGINDLTLTGGTPVP
jgi:Flp pilus assembly pilin Flp